MVWNLGDVIETAGAALPADEPAIIFDGEATSWGSLLDRSARFAGFLQRAGLQRGDKLAFLMRNHPAYLEGCVAALRAGLVHVNVNFRYTGDELWYILDNSDAAAVLYSAEFAPEIAALRQRLPKVAAFIEVTSAAEPVNDFASSYADACSGAPAIWPERSADDLLFVYTGGTTGMPKGVMWPHGELWSALGGGAPMPGMPIPASLDALADNVRQGIGRARIMIAPPFMHGTGLMMSINVLGKGGSVVITSDRSLVPDNIWRAIADHHCSFTVIVGDAFARPLLRALDAAPGRYDLSALKLVISSGAMWSPEIKTALLRHNPGMMLMDTLGASEGVGIGMSISTAAGVAPVGHFQRDERTRVIGEDGRDVAPGSGQIGKVARAGPLPRGYYKDAAKTAGTYVEIDGVRYSIAGDFATVEADGSIRLLGRGSQCINTGGEKVFPEEVEEVIKTHPLVDDVLVVGVPHEKWGSAVTAVVQPAPGAMVDSETIRQHVKAQLASYKAPKSIVCVETVPRGPNGKADYAAAKSFALAALQASTQAA